MPAESQTLLVSGRKIPVMIHYESRTTSRVTIGKRGIIMRISRYLSKMAQSRQVEEFKNWAAGKIHQRPELYATRRKDFYSGMIIPVRDKSFILELHFTDRKICRAAVKEDIIRLHLSAFLDEEELEKTISRLIHKCIAKEFYSWIYAKLRYLNAMHFPKKKFQTLRLKYVTSLWGSCSRHGNITLSTRLLFAPDAVIDYVLVHELAHLYVHNHSAQFWELVEGVMPDYQRCEKWLKENNLFEF
ncbi:MAG TPA: M48 family metallopeptidase [Chitinophagales bacterium]|nr:M48 family metallopeptidase [Chitinophagales bacterium]